MWKSVKYGSFLNTLIPLLISSILQPNHVAIHPFLAILQPQDPVDSDMVLGEYIVQARRGVIDRRGEGDYMRVIALDDLIEDQRKVYGRVTREIVYLVVYCM